VFVAHGFFYSKPGWHHRHVRVPESQRRPIVHSAPLTSPVAREASRQPMPAASGFSDKRKDVREQREHRREAKQHDGANRDQRRHREQRRHRG
jgi:hypothetical protein